MNISFYFDFLSPYAYLAHTQLFELAAQHNVPVEFCPVVLAALLNAYGHKGPAEIPPKRVWVFKETSRRAALMGVPFGLPPTHPFNPLLPLRAVLACPAPARKALCDQLWLEAWGGQATGGLDDPDTVQRCMDAVGLHGAGLLEQTQEPSIKLALREMTERALAAGVFGVPSFQVGEEIFWGFDSLDLLDLYLSGRDPLDPKLVTQAQEIRPSAQR